MMPSQKDRTTELVHSAVDIDHAGDIMGQNFLSVHITDNDAGAVMITETGGSTEIAEGALPTPTQIALATMPTGAVQITVTADAQTQVSMDGGVTYASTLVLTFTNMTPQTITVRAVDDYVDESTHIGSDSRMRSPVRSTIRSIRRSCRLRT